jgi:hypothetical protein
LLQTYRNPKSLSPLSKPRKLANSDDRLHFVYFQAKLGGSTNNTKELYWQYLRYTLYHRESHQPYPSFVSCLGTLENLQVNNIEVNNKPGGEDSGSLFSRCFCSSSIHFIHCSTTGVLLIFLVWFTFRWPSKKKPIVAYESPDQHWHGMGLLSGHPSFCLHVKQKLTKTSLLSVAKSVLHSTN